MWENLKKGDIIKLPLTYSDLVSFSNGTPVLKIKRRLAWKACGNGKLFLSYWH
jgi:hypothetical protein